MNFIFFIDLEGSNLSLDCHLDFPLHFMLLEKRTFLNVTTNPVTHC